MIDIHSHILPGIDDGPQTLEDSLKMLKQSVMDGVTDIIATPHYIKGSYDNTVSIVNRKVELLRNAAAENQLAINIYPGAELYLDIDLLEEIQSGRVPRLNGGNYILIELPAQSVPHGTEEIIFKLLINKLIPIIAHPERNAELIRKPNKLYNLIEKGALTQMNAGSLLGDFGGQVARASKLFLQHKFIHFVGSDSHHHQMRGSKLTKWVEEASAYLGIDQATEMVTNIPKKILDSAEIEFPDPIMLEDEDEKISPNLLKNVFDRLFK